MCANYRENNLQVKPVDYLLTSVNCFIFLYLALILVLGSNIMGIYEGNGITAPELGKKIISG